MFIGQSILEQTLKSSGSVRQIPAAPITLGTPCEPSTDRTPAEADGNVECSHLLPICELRCRTEVSSIHEDMRNGSANGSASLNAQAPGRRDSWDCWGYKDSRRRWESRNWSISCVWSIWSILLAETRTGLSGLFGLSRSMGWLIGKPQKPENQMN